MSSFDQALAYVTDVLTKNRALGETCGEASLGSLQALIQATQSRSGIAQHRSSPTPALAPTQTQHRPVAAQQNPSGDRPRLGLTAQFRATIAEQASVSTPAPIFTPPVPPAASPTSAPAFSPAPAMSKKERLEALFSKLPANALPGRGSLEASLIIVNEQVTADGIAEGRPISGEAGALLEKIIAAMGLDHEEIYLTNLRKSALSDNPKEEAALLAEELSILQPKCIVALGENVASLLARTSSSIDETRGRWHDFRGIPLMPTFTLEHLLENQTLEEKRKFWEDLLQVLELLGHRITTKQRSFFLPKGRGAAAE